MTPLLTLLGAASVMLVHAQKACADVLSPSSLTPIAGAVEQLPLGDLLGYQPAPAPAVPGGASTDRVFDDPVTGSAQPPWAPGSGSLVSWNPGNLYAPGLGNNAGGNLQAGGNGNGNNGCGNGNGGPNGEGCNKSEPPTPQPGVPGPAGLLGAAAAFGWARRLRGRVGR